MKFQILFVFAVSLTWATVAPVAADFEVQAQQMTDMIISEVEKEVNPKCFCQIKNKLKDDVKASICYHLDGIAKEGLTYKKGRMFSLQKFLAQVFRDNKHISKACVKEIKDAYKKVTIAKYRKGQDYID